LENTFAVQIASYFTAILEISYFLTLELKHQTFQQFSATCSKADFKILILRVPFCKSLE